MMNKTFLRAMVLMTVVMGCMASRCGSDQKDAPSEVGKKAYAFTQELVAIGPRPPGSSGIEKARTWLASEVQKMGFTLVTDLFMASTPLGVIEMKNLSYVIAGKQSSQKVILLAHYDSKRFIGFDFVGANDAASSVALLLALSPEIQKRGFSFETEVIFVDGEEALVEWSASDSLYGSRHLTSTLKSQSSIKAAIVVDMIGDADLKLVREKEVDPQLFKVLEEVLKEKGLSQLLDSSITFVQDDHTPLIQAGIPTLHLMDFTYGGSGSPGVYWHTSADTSDKVSAQSLSVVAEIVLGVLGKL